ncbi:hypothetical protein M0P25_04195 [archaeon]|jgi:tRNA G37 N-methylase Trm5|nr:hypothetical protein [archaeon]MCK9439698.1 hypothetical protein [Patescibacteria group bacterium]
MKIKYQKKYKGMFLKIKEKENNVKLKIINKQVIRSFSPAVVQIVMDIMVCKT